jgi:hypothetical protein
LFFCSRCYSTFSIVATFDFILYQYSTFCSVRWCCIYYQYYLLLVLLLQS